MLLVILLMLGTVCQIHSNVHQNQTQDSIKHVHLIFMNHLDVGYSLVNKPGHVVDILNAYFNEYFPRAIQISLQLLALGYRERFIYTTHPWLVSLYLDCPPNLWLTDRKLKCPDDQSKNDFIDAIKRGDITWHAGPMNMEFELMDQSMAEFAIQLSFDLDKRFGINRAHRAVSQRDVPGTTQAMIPILKKMGIDALSIGVNGATTPAALPPVFMWKYQNASILTLYHPGGYPNQYGSSPLQPGGLSRKDCAVISGFDHALCFAFRSDNTGPPVDYKEVLVAHEIARSQFPNAMVQASTFDTVVGLLLDHTSVLPVVTKEMGDVWIQGSASDPFKMAATRAMFRARADCLAKGQCSMSDPRVYNASRFMLKLAEHTWGSAGNCIDNIHWSNDQFYSLLKDPKGSYWNATYFWEEQRNFTLLAIEALNGHPLAETLHRELAGIQPAVPSLLDYREVSPTSEVTCGQFKLKFDQHGTVVQLIDDNGKNWASVDHPIGQFVYQTYNQTDFDRFNSATTPYSKDFFLGIGKPNLTENAYAESKIWGTKMNSVHVNNDQSSVFVQMSMDDPVTRSYYGAPETITLNYTCNGGIDLTLQWENKVPTRLPEGISLVFEPLPQPGYHWLMNKIEDMVDPLNVVTNGSQRLHAINRGVYYINDAYKRIEITSPDAALVNVLTDEDYVSSLPIPLKPISSVRGMAFNLYNNVWETNYIFWYPYRNKDSSQKFRFSMKMV